MMLQGVLSKTQDGAAPSAIRNMVLKIGVPVMKEMPYHNSDPGILTTFVH